MKLLMSACLLGVNCRYNGERKALPDDVLQRLLERHTVVPVCPEQLGGLTTPREPSERQGERVVMRSGRDVTAEYTRGAQEVLRLARRFGCTAAVLKERIAKAEAARSQEQPAEEAPEAPVESETAAETETEETK